MIVLHIVNVRWYNATAWYALTLANIGNKNKDTHIIASIKNAPILKKADEYSIANFALDFNSNNPIKIINTLYLMHKKVAEIKPDIIVAHRGEFFIFLAMIKLLRPKKWKLIRVRGDNRKPTSDIISRVTHNNIADAIIVTASKIRDYFINNLKTKQDHIHLIYGGVDKTVFKSNMKARELIRKKFHYKDSDYIVAIVGRFDPVKGHINFFKALGYIYKKKLIKNLKIMVIGFAENRSLQDIMDMAKDNGVDRITNIIGKVENISAYMNASDLGVVASLDSEVIARVAFEFIAVGKDVIASDVGVLPDIINPYNIYHHDDYMELANKIIDHKPQLVKYHSDKFYKDFKKVIENLE